MFNIGDKVVVVNASKQYSAYSRWAEVMGLSNFKSCSLLRGGEECEVVCRGLHGFQSDRILYGIKTSNGDEYIVDEEGLNKAPKKVFLDLEIIAKTGVQVYEHGAKAGYNGWPVSTIALNLETGEVTQIN